MQGYDLIRAERIRQVHSEHYTPAKDAGREDELIDAARAYAYAATWYDPREVDASIAKAAYWPWSSRWWKPADRKRTLIKAGALIAAAIDALETEEKEVVHE